MDHLLLESLKLLFERLIPLSVKLFANELDVAGASPDSVFRTR